MSSENKIKIYGNIVDDETRCTHYHSEKDIIAIKFKCCQKYYPCYKCHEENENHEIIVWDRDELDEKAIICGVCKTEIPINKYMEIENCINCASKFNEGCEKHYHLYFDVNYSCQK